jgi:hypothetical protein
MMAKKQDNLADFLTSHPTELINNRFLVKASVLNTGAFKPTIMLVIYDLIERNFKLTYYNDVDLASNMIKLLKQT